MLKNKFVCITGLPGAGKSVVADYFAAKDYQFIRFGQITIDQIKKRGLKINEANEKKVREDIRKKHGMSAFAILNYPQFKKLLTQGDVIADGLYSWSEYKYLKKRLGKQMYLIAVFAPPQLRHHRLTHRKLSKTDRASRFRPLSVKEAQTRDRLEIENLEKGGPIAMADYTILNTSSIGSFKRQLNKIYQAIQTQK